MSRTVVSAPDLQQALAWVCAAIPTRSSIPLLTAVVLESTDDGLVLSGFDGDVAASVVVEQPTLDAAGIARTLVPGHLMRAMVDQLDGDVSLDDGALLTIKAGRATYRLNAMPGEFYPGLPAEPPLVGTIDADALAGLVAATVGAVAQDPGLGVLLGISIESAEHSLTATACDRHRAHRTVVPWSAEAEGVGLRLVVPGKRLAALTGSLRGTVAVHTDGNVLMLADATRSAMVNLFAGEYPNTASWWTSEPEMSLVVGREALARAAKAAAIGLAEQHVDITCGADELWLRAAGEQGDAAIGLNAASDLDGFTVRVNGQYLADATSPLAGSHVRVGLLGASNTRVYLSGLDGADGEPDPSTTTLVMSIRKAEQ